MDYIDIKGYKSIKDLRLELNRINVLIGANGAGKTNFISFFSFLKTAYDGQLKSFVTGRGIDTILHHGRKETETLFTQLSFDGGTNRYDFHLKVENKTFVVQSENLWYHENDWQIADSLTELKVRTSNIHRANYINLYLNKVQD